MKNFPSRHLTGAYGVVTSAFIAISSIAGENGTQAISAENTSAPSTFPFSGEFVVDETYVGNGDVQRGQHALRDFDENDILLHFVLTPRIKLGVLRLGAEWERFSFGFSDRAPLPDTLQAVSLVLGLDTQLSDSILLRFQAQPGFYGTDNFESQDVNIPFVVGGTYIYSPNLQLILGIPNLFFLLPFSPFSPHFFALFFRLFFFAPQIKSKCIHVLREGCKYHCGTFSYK